MQLRANLKSKGKGKESKGEGKGKDVNNKGKGKDAKNESSKKTKNDDQRKCFCCQKTGHVKAECRKRLKDLAEAEGKPVAASPHDPNDTASVLPLQCLLPGETADADTASVSPSGLAETQAVAMAWRPGDDCTAKTTPRRPCDAWRFFSRFRTLLDASALRISDMRWRTGSRRNVNTRCSLTAMDDPARHRLMPKSLEETVVFNNEDEGFQELF